MMQRILGWGLGVGWGRSLCKGLEAGTASRKFLTDRYPLLCKSSQTTLPVRMGCPRVSTPPACVPLDSPDSTRPP